MSVAPFEPKKVAKVWRIMWRVSLGRPTFSASHPVTLFRPHLLYFLYIDRDTNPYTRIHPTMKLIAAVAALTLVAGGVDVEAQKKR